MNWRVLCWMRTFGGLWYIEMTGRNDNKTYSLLKTRSELETWRKPHFNKTIVLVTWFENKSQKMEQAQSKIVKQSTLECWSPQCQDFSSHQLKGRRETIAVVSCAEIITLKQCKFPWLRSRSNLTYKTARKTQMWKEVTSWCSPCLMWDFPLCAMNKIG